ncbi:MAG: DUF559 domain-containing protein [Bacteroidota bacterium]|jgi:very-short-patch-repair endonuclease
MRKSILYTDPKAKEIAKIVQKNSSLGEIMLWKKLCDRQLLGYEFLRHKPIGKYIVDFFCIELNLAIEVDGVSQETDQAYRFVSEREAKLEKVDVHFLRFNDSNVRNDIKSVLLEIEGWIKEHTKPVKKADT